MNFQQLEYIVALDDFKHFRKAAEHCDVTQPTLSMMVKKLEDELDVSLFDRSKQPIMPTEVGREVIARARKATREVQEISDAVQQHRGQVVGKLCIGVIPTLAPYLLPLFVQPLLKKYPEVELQVQEMVTEEIQEALQSGSVDIGVMVSPLQYENLLETVLFYEKLYAYVASSNRLYDKQYILPQDIAANQLWLLEEGHSFRNQVISLCGLKEPGIRKMRFNYETGSIETLKKLVEQSSGVTILPELALHDMPDNERRHIRAFGDPEPTREISLVTHRTFFKKQLINVLREEILEVVPADITKRAYKVNVLD